MSKFILAIVIIMTVVFVGYTVGNAANNYIEVEGQRIQDQINTYNYCK